ncbi:MAG: biopolymer transporter ExbD [Bacteroidota bacterium]|nr:biopolymer transporter ExbD [Bacteroidota bacterium]
MAELDTSGGGKHKGGKVRSKKASTRVDLTAMVDLAFLLITFFMFTTTLNKPKAMNLTKPDNTIKTSQLPVPETRTMTILLGAKNKAAWFIGKPGATAPTIVGFGANGLRKDLVDNGKKIAAEHPGPDGYMIVVVHPSDKSTYEDLVNTLDELSITNVKAYSIGKILPAEADALKAQGLL